MNYPKKSKAEWEQEALLREGEALTTYSDQYQVVVATPAGQSLLIAHELRQLREQVKWLVTAIKKLAPATDDKVPF